MVFHPTLFNICTFTQVVQFKSRYRRPLGISKVRNSNSTRLFSSHNSNTTFYSVITTALIKSSFLCSKAVRIHGLDPRRSCALHEGRRGETLVKLEYSCMKCIVLPSIEPADCASYSLLCHSTTLFVVPSLSYRPICLPAIYLPNFSLVFRVNHGYR